MRETWLSLAVRRARLIRALGVQFSLPIDGKQFLIYEVNSMKQKPIPPYESLMNPVIQALKTLGGSGTIEEINNRVIEIVGFSDDQLEIIHDPERGSQTEIEYRLHWARTYLKKYGILENSSRGVWALTAKGKQTDNVNPNVVKQFVRAQRKKTQPDPVDYEPDESDLEPSWRDEVLSSLLKMEPSSFERLAQRLLRESGFIQVEVTGRSGDGGIDGKGIMRLGGLLSFHVIFQCKRYKGSVRAEQVRDFRGAMVGRADKGLIITTGNFTKDAIREASRDGAPTIDLVDGDQLVEKLRELGLGVQTKKVEVEEITIDKIWFSTL
jgi:restriction system protein